MRGFVQSIFLVLLTGCGIDAGGGPLSTRVPELPPEQSAATDHGDGSDTQSGEPRGSVPPFGRCVEDRECAHGSCSKNTLSSSGRCLTLCTAPTIIPLNGLRIEPCPTGEECVIVDDDLGVCARPCTTTVDCLVGRCEALPNGSGRVCFPSGGDDSPSSGEEVPPPEPR
jgi:hypothetical protein